MKCYTLLRNQTVSRVYRVCKSEYWRLVTFDISKHMLCIAHMWVYRASIEICFEELFYSPFSGKYRLLWRDNFCRTFFSVGWITTRIYIIFLWYTFTTLCIISIYIWSNSNINFALQYFRIHFKWKELQSWQQQERQKNENLHATNVRVYNKNTTVILCVCSFPLIIKIIEKISRSS